MNIVEPRIQAYLQELMPVRHDTLRAMEAYAAQQGFPIIGPLVGVLLKQLALAVRATRIFELGSGFGYSALWFAEGMPSGGKIFLTDRKEENRRKAIANFQAAGHLEKMEFIVGEALEIFRHQTGPFDIVLNDIDKREYPEVPGLVKEKLRPGGLLLADNVLLRGKVTDKKAQDDATTGIREFNRLLADDPDFITAIIPLRDGLSVAVKR